MRTVTVSSIVTNAASRAGLDGSVSIDSLPTTTKTIMVDNLSSAPSGRLGILRLARPHAHRRADHADRSGRGHLY
jgi:hypothetical protein